VQFVRIFLAEPLSFESLLFFSSVDFVDKRDILENVLFVQDECFVNIQAVLFVEEKSFFRFSSTTLYIFVRIEPILFLHSSASILCAFQEYI